MLDARKIKAISHEIEAIKSKEGFKTDDQAGAYRALKGNVGTAAGVGAAMGAGLSVLAHKLGELDAQGTLKPSSGLLPVESMTDALPYVAGVSALAGGSRALSNYLYKKAILKPRGADLASFMVKHPDPNSVTVPLNLAAGAMLGGLHKIVYDRIGVPDRVTNPASIGIGLAAAGLGTGADLLRNRKLKEALAVKQARQRGLLNG